jgi:hypothetical protein
MRNVWDDLFDEDLLAGMNAKLRAAQKLADRQAFGMPRPELTVQFREQMDGVRQDIDRLLERVAACEPQETTLLKGRQLDAHEAFVHNLNKHLSDVSRLHRTRR